MVETALLTFLVVATNLSIAAQAGSTTATFRSDTAKLELIEKAVEPWNTARRWLIEYDVLDTLAPSNSHQRNIMAAGAPGEYYKLKANGTRFYPWQSDPFAMESFIHEGARCVKWPFNRKYRLIPIKPGDHVEGTFRFDVLWRVIPSCPITQYRIPNLDTPQTSPLLGGALRSADCRLLDGFEVIKGENCLVFVYDDGNALKKTWIAERVGLCLMKEEIRYSHSNALIQRIVTDETGEVARGCWMPIGYRIQWFQGDGNEDVPNREVKVRILRCLINDDVPASTFVPTHAAGSIQDDGNQFTQVSPGGDDLLLQMVHFMTNYARLPTKEVSSVRTYMWPLAGLACGLGLGLLVLPYKRQASPSTVLRTEAPQ
jgi:hypothetical protein